MPSLRATKSGATIELKSSRLWVGFTALEAEVDLLRLIPSITASQCNSIKTRNPREIMFRAFRLPPPHHNLFQESGGILFIRVCPLPPCPEERKSLVNNGSGNNGVVCCSS